MPTPTTSPQYSEMDTSTDHIADLIRDIIHLLRKHQTTTKRKSKADFIEGESHALTKSPDEVKAMLEYSTRRIERLLEELQTYDADRFRTAVERNSRMRDIACSFYATRVRLCIIDIQKRWGILLVNDTGPSWGDWERRVEELVSEYDGVEVA